jgi:hypothetical protein
MADNEQANTDDVLHKELARLRAENEQLRSHFHVAEPERSRRKNEPRQVRVLLLPTCLRRRNPES